MGGFFGELADLEVQDLDLLAQQPQLLLLHLDLGIGGLGVLGGCGELLAGCGQLGQGRRALAALLVGPGERLAVLSFERPETCGGFVGSPHCPRGPLLGLGPSLCNRPQSCGCFLGPPRSQSGLLLGLAPRLLDDRQPRADLFTPTLRLLTPQGGLLSP
ncbi:hypothetical protein ASE41_20415 [Streptomyces sp. Root264]|nr:hypothetical protein ASE41_20415 [Streptomyces sp. Root264]